jgi:hypothetical protein
MSASELGACCGTCDGPMYMHTCTEFYDTGHDWVVAVECLTCGARHPVICVDCGRTDPIDGAP